MRSTFRTKWLALALAGVSVLAPASQAADLTLLPTVTPLVKGQDFRELTTPMRTSVPEGDIEVIGFFHYDSPWADQVAPFVQTWLDTQAGSRVHFQWAPAVLSEDWGWGARVFFALDQIGQASGLNSELMDAYGTHQLAYGDTAGLITWLHDHRADDKGFSAALNDGKTIARTTWVPTVMGLYEVRTLPAFVINGRYVVEASDSVTPLMALARTRYIVENLQRLAKTP